MRFRFVQADVSQGVMPAIWIYFCCGVAYWCIALAAYGESEGTRTLRPGLRLRVHATALLLSMLLWPIAVPVALARGLSR